MNQEQDYKLAIKEAKHLATYMWKKFYSEESPNFELCDSLAGIMTQIDNMLTGLEKKSGLYYTKERPKKSGWYWAKRYDIEINEPVVVDVCGEETWVEINGNHNSYIIDFDKDENETEDDVSTIGGKNIEWYGPIKAPR